MPLLLLRSPPLLALLLTLDPGLSFNCLIVMTGIIGAAVVTLTMLPALTVFVLNWHLRFEKQKSANSGTCG